MVQIGRYQQPTTGCGNSALVPEGSRPRDERSQAVDLMVVIGRESLDLAVVEPHDGQLLDLPENNAELVCCCILTDIEASSACPTKERIYRVTCTMSARFSVSNNGISRFSIAVSSRLV